MSKKTNDEIQLIPDGVRSSLGLLTHTVYKQTIVTSIRKPPVKLDTNHAKGGTNSKSVGREGRSQLCDDKVISNLMHNTITW